MSLSSLVPHQKKLFWLGAAAMAAYLFRPKLGYKLKIVQVLDIGMNTLTRFESGGDLNRGRAIMNFLTVIFSRRPKVHSVQERTIPGPHGHIRIRIYVPNPKQSLPMTMFFHGGGWTILSLDSHDEICRNICIQAETIVISVDYRMAPEHKFPVAFDECYAATMWCYENAAHLSGDSSRMAVAGDSAGGNLATTVALKARNMESDLKLLTQVLIYPATDYLSSTPSKEQGKNAIMLNTGKMTWFWRNYLRTPADAENQYACPARAENFTNLPPCFIITCEWDPLRDEGEDYGRLLFEAGNTVETVRFKSIHGFLNMGFLLSECRTALRLIGNHLHSTFYPKA